MWSLLQEPPRQTDAQSFPESSMGSKTPEVMPQLVKVMSSSETSCYIRLEFTRQAVKVQGGIHHRRDLLAEDIICQNVSTIPSFFEDLFVQTTNVLLY